MLYSLFHNTKNELVTKWVHYFPVYERHLKDFVNKSVVMIEIGVFKGGSLKMWKKYLGPYASIVGIDIDPECERYEDDQCRVRIGGQGDFKFLSNVIKEFGRPDIVIDDGSHMMHDMDATFQFLYPLLNNNGVYIVEDTHTCYWEQYGGGLGNPSSFIEKAKSLVDSLNAHHISKETVDNFTNSTFSVCFYDSMVVFEKRHRGAPYSITIGDQNC
ncbi:MAG: hypothetical protein DELT_00296 [Desulfovibrio sp.]